MKVSTPVYDIYSLFLSVEFGSIDISGLIDEYFKENELLDYEIKWLLTLLFIVCIVLEPFFLPKFVNILSKYGFLA